ncbi:MAG: hypothetical protein ACREMN_09045 [Gemmatimonadales bacterium]
MAQQPHGASVVRRLEELQQHLRTVEHVKKLVAELESSRAARPAIIDGICNNIARELSQLRQRALTSNIGTLADVAGGLAVVAARAGGGLNLKIRALAEGVNSMLMQLDQGLKTVRDQKSAEKPR